MIRSPRLDLQIKSTAQGALGKGQFGYQLPLKNYDDLRHEDYLAPRILVVVFMPEIADRVLSQTHASLSMRHCGYWLSLRGMSDYAGRGDKVTIKVLKKQRFDGDAITKIMKRIAEGDQP